MSLALTVLSDLAPEMKWALGGGTALALHLNHRVSFDVDVFFEHPGALKALMKNPRTKQLADDWEFPGNYLKLIRPEGEIDFILAANVTDDYCRRFDFNGSMIHIETPREIIAKKIKYRGSKFTYRDTYDLAATIRVDLNLLSHLSTIEELDGILPRLIQRIAFLQENADALYTQLTEADSTLQTRMFNICIQELKKWKTK